jgi:tRNA(fMet)-specific endonuclease VapC
MIMLDTDHLSVLADERDSRHGMLRKRTEMEAVEDEVACTIVGIEEVLRGWLAVIHRIRDVRHQVPAYTRLLKFIQYIGEWKVAPFDDIAADQFVRLRRQRIRIGTMDLKIASIALVQPARLITSNTRDYSQVPNLHCENWL